MNTERTHGREPACRERRLRLADDSRRITFLAAFAQELRTNSFRTNS